MDNPEKLTTQTKKSKAKTNTTQYVLNTTVWKQTQIMKIKYEISYKQLDAKTNRTSFLMRNRSGQHNTALTTQRRIIGPHKKNRVNSSAREG